MKRLLIFTLLFQCISAAKIGVFTAAISNSQIIFNIRIAEVLVEAGHDVVLIRPEYNEQSTHIHSSNKKIREIHTKAAPPELFQKFTEIEHEELFRGLRWTELFEFSAIYNNLAKESCRAMLSNDSFLTEIKNEKFDLAIMHHIDLCQLGIAHEFGVRKWIYTMPGPAHKILLNDMGLPSFPSIMPGLMTNRTNEMSWIERTLNFVQCQIFDFLGPTTLDKPETQVLREKFGNHVPELSALRKTAALAFVQSDPVLEFPFPHTTKLQFIAGIGQSKVKPLKEPFKSFMNKSSAAVLVSFGSVAKASEMPDTWKQALIECFKRHPEVSFIWKFEEEIDVPSNVLRNKWIPQNDLLGHPNMKGFITHGGYNSLGETVLAGVPAVLIPLFADQFRNARMAQARGFGIQLSKYDFSADSLSRSLEDILNDDSYRQKAKMYQKIMLSKPVKPEQIVTYWTNMVLETEIDLSIPQLNVFALYSIDSIATLSFIVVLALLILRKIASLYYWSCFKMAFKEKDKID